MSSPTIDDINKKAAEKSSAKESLIQAASVPSDHEILLEELKALSAKQAELQRNLAELKAGREGIKSSAERLKPVKTDFSKLTEESAYDYNIPIEAISFDLPSYMDFNHLLKDQNFIGRWINANPARLGPMKAAGFIPVTKDDLVDELPLAITLDMNGYYKFIDVIAMRIHKEKYFAALRKNHKQSIMLTDPDKIHELSKTKADEYMNSLDPKLVADWEYAKRTGSDKRPKMEVYI
jgi:hypothetical protein